jgi:hypothetical protein
VFAFVMVSEGDITDPVVVKLRIPAQSARLDSDDAPALSVARWDEDSGHWALLPTRTGRDGYLYAPTVQLGVFGVAEAGEVLLWKESGTLEPGSYWGLFSDDGSASRIALADTTGRRLPAEEIAALDGLLKPDRASAAIAGASDFSIVGNSVAMSVSDLLGGPLAPDASYVTPVPDNARPVANGNDVSLSDWKVIQVQAPIPYEERLGWKVVPVRGRLVQRGDVTYLEYASNVNVDDVAPVDFVWLVYGEDGAWTFARLNAAQLRAGVLELSAPPVRVSLMVYGQPYEAWQVWGPGSTYSRHIFSVGAVSWSEEATTDGAPGETAEVEATLWRAPTPTVTGETPAAPTATATY